MDHYKITYKSVIYENYNLFLKKSLLFIISSIVDSLCMYVYRLCFEKVQQLLTP